MYIPLHCHSHYSLLDGLSKPADIADRFVEIGATAGAITDHGNISASVEFCKEMKKKGLKPILGCELYVSKEHASIHTPENRKMTHLVVLAKNYEGWNNLIRLVSESNKKENFYYKPRLSIDQIEEIVDGENLIAFSGHLGSCLAQSIIDETDTANLALKYNNIFGNNNFFVEIQLIDTVNDLAQKTAFTLRKLAKYLEISTVATPDAHYCRREDADDQRVLLGTALDITKKQMISKINNGQDAPMSAFFNSNNYHIPTYDEMVEAGNTPDEINSTLVINDMCENYDILHKPIIPQFTSPDNLTSDEYLRELCIKGWKEKILPKIIDNPTLRKEYGDRIRHELDVFIDADLAGYLLIVWDYLKAARSRGELLGPGRGSVGGSLVAYIIGITMVDPIEYDLIFERFYNAGRNTEDRTSLPDIDCDFQISKRADTIEYIKQKYGQAHVAQMTTFGRMMGRGGLKDVLRYHDACDFHEMNRITKNIPDEAAISDQLQTMKDRDGKSSIILWALENKADDLREWCYLDDDGNYQGPMSKLFEQAVRLEGTKRNQGKHAAGLIISQAPIAEVCPMIFDKHTDEAIAGLDMNALEDMGHVKFDILGIALLDKVQGVRTLLQGEQIS